MDCNMPSFSVLCHLPEFAQFMSLESVILYYFFPLAHREVLETDYLFVYPRSATYKLVTINVMFLAIHLTDCDFFLC